MTAWPRFIRLCALVGTALGVLALPAQGSAAQRKGDPLRGAEVQSVSADLTIALQRCPEGTPEGGTGCERLSLRSSFSGSAAPASRALRGRRGFDRGVRVSGTGSGSCESESAPAEPMVGPGGEVIGIGSAVRVRPARSRSTDFLFSSDRRGARWAWPEPLEPAADCHYFDEDWTAQVPAADGGVPRGMTSAMQRPRRLARRSFSVRIAGETRWDEVQGEGASAKRIYGRASWDSELRYRRAE